VKRSLFFKFFAALILGLVVISVLDRLDVSTVSAPLCLGIVLMGASLRQSPSLVVAISLAYILLVTYSAFYFFYYSTHPRLPFPYPVFALVQRVGLFVVVCAMAIYMSVYRATSEQTLADVRNTLSKLPVPVVISDPRGLIIYTNESLNASLQYLPPDLTGKRYMDFFMPAVQEGNAWRHYIKIFGDEGDKVHEMEITPLGGTIPMVARLTCHGTGAQRTLVTVLHPPESSLKPAWVGDGR